MQEVYLRGNMRQTKDKNYFFGFLNFTEERKPKGIQVDDENRQIFWGGDGTDGGVFVTEMDGFPTEKLTNSPANVLSIFLDSDNE